MNMEDSTCHMISAISILFYLLTSMLISLPVVASAESEIRGMLEAFGCDDPTACKADSGVVRQSVQPFSVKDLTSGV